MEFEDLLNVHCIEIKVKQAIKNGWLGGPYKYGFTIDYKSKNYSVSIVQGGCRWIYIHVNGSSTLAEVLDLFNSVEQIMMLVEGTFIPVVEAFVIEESEEKCCDIYPGLIESRLDYYASASYMRRNYSKLVDSHLVINSNLINKWDKLKMELDINYSMAMYTMSDVAFPVECKCAFLIEAFLTLAELVKKTNDTFILPRVKRSESMLGKYIEAIILEFGMDIFKGEITTNSDKFIEILINSRNRIGHIKSRQGREYLDAQESLLYLVKLSYLYRIVILNLLDVDYMIYKVKLIDSVSVLNNWGSIYSSFVSKLRN